MANVSHKGAIITEVVQGRKNPQETYFTVIDNDGTFNYSTKVVDFPSLYAAKLQRCNIDAVVAGRRFGQNQNLTALQLSIKAEGK